jgi:solute carrier family 25 iron transporter 28/37
MHVFATSPAATYIGVGNADLLDGRTLWKGAPSAIVGAGPAHAVHVGTYEAVKELTGGDEKGQQSQWIAACEFLSRSSHRVLLRPEMTRIN